MLHSPLLYLTLPFGRDNEIQRLLPKAVNKKHSWVRASKRLTCREFKSRLRGVKDIIKPQVLPTPSGPKGEEVIPSYRDITFKYDPPLCSSSFPAWATHWFLVGLDCSPAWNVRAPTPKWHQCLIYLSNKIYACGRTSNHSTEKYKMSSKTLSQFLFPKIITGKSFGVLFQRKL